ncbi:NIPSNAP family protein [Plantactinospora sp. KLBMP9567]|uniref:NIPSNAP family protein n=1 Tax=Plantactinospora sp. KLBMP9567 TaxID=3085900 RepID=UPI002981BCC4|nr:NIPSNAP family protein [Plantactinospora sp. KLBMP9567]MDW5328497.1 NIPSNAP family protein [Plantactinospora sp. KLBMP9567]
MSDGVRHPVVELRQYTLHGGARDVLVDLFDREFVESQEAAGMAIIGQFQDLAEPDRFVWLRGFPDMPRRAAALHEFYAGPVWQRHRERANATMVDSDDVLLLRPLDERSGFPAPAVRPPVGRGNRPASLVMVTLCLRADPVDQAFTDLFHRRIRPLLVETGAAPVACLSTEYAENTYPALPVRTGEHVLCWLTRFADATRLNDHLRRLGRSIRWRDEVLPELRAALVAPPRQLRLAPTTRSALR